MGSTLVSQMVRSSLRPLREALRREEHCYTQEEMQELFDACAVEALLMEKLWENNGKLLDHGLEGKELASLISESRDAVEEGLSLLAKVREIAGRDLAAFEGKREGRLKLDSFSGRAKEIRDQLVALLHWLNTGPPRVDPAAIAGGGDAPTAEGYENVGAVPASTAGRRSMT